MARYLVETCFKPGIWVLIHKTDNRDHAVSSANFWDERQDTRMVDLMWISPYDRAMRKFDAAIARLEKEKEIR
jgi:hypothetical protein